MQCLLCFLPFCRLSVSIMNTDLACVPLSLARRGYWRYGNLIDWLIDNYEHNFLTICKHPAGKRGCILVFSRSATTRSIFLWNITKKARGINFMLCRWSLRGWGLLSLEGWFLLTEVKEIYSASLQNCWSKCFITQPGIPLDQYLGLKRLRVHFDCTCKFMINWKVV